jgi:zinc/manganese transport system substrate-binding protein
MGRSRTYHNSIAITRSLQKRFAMRFMLSLLGVLATACPILAAPMQVTALHPLMADLARQIGGDRVTVIDLAGDGVNPHHFEPRPADLKKLNRSAVILAAGKGMETYLGRIQPAIAGATLVEVGRTIPSLAVGKDAVYVCCPHHASGSIDPHWWHGVENMRRAARIVAEAFSARDPDGKKHYTDAATAYGSRMAALKKWAKSELAHVPRERRKLVTAHNAFGYFAREFGYEVIAVAGLNREQDSTPHQRAQTIQSVKDSGVSAVFPEYGVSEKELEAVAKAAGKHMAQALIADGNGKGQSAGFEGMIRHNVLAITAALAGE